MEDLLVKIALLLCSVFALSKSQPGVCSRTVSHGHTVSYRSTSYLMEGYKCGIFGWGRCYRRATRYHTRYRTHTTYSAAHQCCPGYHDPAGGLNCRRCMPLCVHGSCNYFTLNCVCSPGYTGVACQDDIDECETNNGNCDQVCTNTFGSYTCSCREGFRALTPDASSCKDIDECVETDHGCSQVCTNTPGLFYCNCQRGFQRVGTTECEDVNECSVLNGFCSQLCINTDGSYHCGCREGYRLFGSTLCHDVDECAEMSDECNRTGLAPADCINTDGSYECSCSHHGAGYILSADGTTCEDVDECSKGDHLCSMLCVNTPGSYHCSCPEGYQLGDDEITCHDIDECEVSVCQHSCVNTVGSFHCECDTGYLISSDGFSCEAQSCDPVLVAPLNGTIDCDRQTVGGTCSFTCDKGFTLRGGETRTCLPSLIWRERPAMCDPPMCPELEPPANGFVLFPCTRREGDSCSVVCAHGYRANGLTVQTCQRDTVSDSLVWSGGPQCVVSDPCSPNPCANGGICTRSDSEDLFTCACNGTGYGGPTCNIAIIRLAPIPPTRAGVFIRVDIFTDATPTGEPFRIPVSVQRTVGETLKFVLTLQSGIRSVGQSLMAEAGIMIVMLTGASADLMYEPQQQSVLVSSGSGNEETYFQQLGLPRGQLRPSCCRSDDQLTLSCPGSTETISLTSPCRWSTSRASVTRTLGSVFAQSTALSLPTSISGLRYRDIPGDYLNSFRNSAGQCRSCTACQNDQSSECYCYTHTPQNALEFLQSRALGYTYISEINKLLPSWLGLSVNLEYIQESSPFTEFDFFAPLTQSSDEVSSIEGCSKLSGLMNGIFSVLRYDKTLSAVIDGELYTYSEGQDSENTMCFAVDMCHGLLSPVHIQISQAVSDILASQYLSQFTDQQWSFVFNTVSVYNSPVLRSATTEFWNGVKILATPDVQIDVSLNVEAGIVFSGNDLIMRLDFAGNAAIAYEESVGYLEGDVVLMVESTIDSTVQYFKLTNSHTNSYYHISEAGNPCQRLNTDLYGVSFTASYEPQPGEVFFTRLLRLPESAQMCDFEAFIPVDSQYRALGLSLHTECPLLAIGELIFPDMTHTISFTSSREPNCVTTNFLGVTSPALVIESELVSDRMRLGNFLELNPNPSGPDITTVFHRGTDEGALSQLHAVKVALFGEMFLTEANIVRDQLVIISNSPVFGYPAEYTVTAPSNTTNWNGLQYTLEGSLLSAGDGSLVQKLSAIVVEKLAQLARSGAVRRSVAQMAFDQSQERLKNIEDQLAEAEANVTQASEERAAANIAVQTAQDRVTQLEAEFNSTQDDRAQLMEELDNLCQEDTCDDVCMPGRSCRECTRPTFVIRTGSCPVRTIVNKVVRVPHYILVGSSWEWVYKCRSYHTRTCIFWIICFTSRHSRCSSVCCRVPRYKLHYREVVIEVEMVVLQECIKTEFSAFIPDTCCEDVDCAVRAPSPDCVAGNAVCRSQRQAATDVNENLSVESRDLFQQLTDARRRLSLARTAARKADITHDKYVVRRDQLRTSRDRLREAYETSRAVYDETLEEIEPLLRLHDAGTENGFENIFRINSVTFNTETATSPSTLALTISFEKQIGTENTVYEEVYGYVAQRGEANLERIANSIIDLAFMSDSKRSTMMLHARVGRQAEDEEELSERHVFESRCAHIKNTHMFFAEIEAKLREVQERINASREGMHQISQNLTNLGNVSVDEEIIAYLDLLKDYEDLSMESLRALENTIFSEWQASMELLYSQSGSVGEMNCDGFADCVQTAIDELRTLVSLTPPSELSEEFVSLDVSFDAAEEQVLQLALFSNITIDGGLMRIAPIIKIIIAYASNNFWCNEPPVIVTQLPPALNISMGDTLQLSCKAESNLNLTYEWRRDDNVLPQYTTNTLTLSTIQRLDSANYSCHASNPVGTTDTIPTAVIVYELPQFYLQPSPAVTYFGDDAGAWLGCNATAWPYPGWRWYHRRSVNDDWVEIEGEDTNELLILDPQEEDQGFYACEAFNYHGSLRSESVTLTLLPFSISQQLTPLQFSISTVNQSCSQANLSSNIYSLIEETIGSETATLQDFNITEIDVENYDISLSLVSQDVTNPYIHLMPYDEIANLVLPHTRSLSDSVQLVRDILSGSDFGSQVCPEADHEVVVEEGSVVLGKQTYICPPGQRLHSDYLLCLSCEQGKFSSEAELSRIVNGVGYSERVPVCQACPLDTYADQLGTSTCLPCPKYHTTTFTGATSIADCLPQPLVMECSADSSNRGHVTVNCKTNRPVVKTLCSFNNGPQHTCTYPVHINREVSPIGNHSVTFSVEDDEGFQTQTTVSYLLETAGKPTATPEVPPLEVCFINDSPRVLNDSVEADISLSRPVSSLVCRLKARGGSDTIEKDCSSGQVVFDSLNSTLYTLRVVATNRHPDKEFIKGTFRLTSDPDQCTVHLINCGVTVFGDMASVEFAGRGPATGYQCTFDMMEPYQCSSPVVLTGLTSGTHTLKVTPTGCGRKRMNLKTKIDVA